MLTKKSDYLVVSSDYYGYADLFAQQISSYSHSVEFIDLRSCKPFSKEQVIAYVYRSFLKLNNPTIVFMGGSIAYFSDVATVIGKLTKNIALYLYDNVDRYPFDQLNDLLRKASHFISYSSLDCLRISKIFPNLYCMNIPLYSAFTSSTPLPETPSICFFGSVHTSNYSLRRYWLRHTSILASSMSLPFYIYSSGSLSAPLKILRDFFYLPSCLKNFRFIHYTPKDVPVIIKKHTMCLNIPADDQYDGLPMRTFEVIANSRFLLSPYSKILESTLQSPFSRLFSSPSEFKALIKELSAQSQPLPCVNLSDYLLQARVRDFLEFV
jgi:hypothetical protein